MSDIKFCCPKCGSHMFGSSTNPDGSLMRHCHGNEIWNCDFSFNQSDDDKYFKEEKHPLEEELAQKIKALQIEHNTCVSLAKELAKVYDKLSAAQAKIAELEHKIRQNGHNVHAEAEQVGISARNKYLEERYRKMQCCGNCKLEADMKEWCLKLRKKYVFRCDHWEDKRQ